MNALKFHNPISKALGHEDTAAAASEYRGLHHESSGGTLESRNDKYMTMVNHYYDLVTDFYEYGWGQSFHFAPRKLGEDFEASVARHERYLAQDLGLTPGMKVLDVGCGVGGPLREISKTSGANVFGLNNNDYQLGKCDAYNKEAGLAHRCGTIKGDFMNIPAKTKSFDAAYQIEATCHAPDKVQVYSEIFRVLKPGGVFGGYEWCMTPKFDPDSLKHQKLKKGIEEGDALPDIAPFSGVTDALKEAGFKVITARDVADESDPQTPWYRALEGRDLTFSSIPRTTIGRKITTAAVTVLERLGIAPKGTTEVNEFLNIAADSLVAAGRLGIFTPMYYFKAQKLKN